MRDCIFCKIIKGEIPSFKIYENQDVFAFLDINPVTKGHCLVIPKKHFEDIFDIDADILQKIIVVSQEISTRIKNLFNAEGINIRHNTGLIAGQDVPHFHIHIIPRKRDDGVNFSLCWKPIKIDQEELKKLAEEIKKKNERVPES